MNYDRVVSSLYMGNAPVPADAKALSVFRDVVLCAKEHQPELTGVNVIRFPIPDALLSANEKAEAVTVAKKVAKNIDRDQPTLVTCWAGLNRSGLICALALRESVRHKCSAEQAIHLVRSARGERALFNKHFVGLINDYKPSWA